MPTRHPADVPAARVAERLQNDAEGGMLFPGAERHLDPPTPAGLADLDFVAKHAEQLCRNALGLRKESENFTHWPSSLVTLTLSD